MTKNVFTALNFIHGKGLDNSQWGFEDGCNEVPLAEMFPIDKGIWGNVACPRSFLYIWVDLETADRLNRLNLKPTWTMHDVLDRYEIFIWDLKVEEGA